MFRNYGGKVYWFASLTKKWYLYGDTGNHREIFDAKIITELNKIKAMEEL